ncbi:response regulator [Lysobacter niastensis]|uniref:Response regulator n=1 Tax=Lysobacter niastensis TaxID=380629 RepID=A0ABS0B7T7_9GAMM|nr:response regulator [Lysobacter niastensis]MBF6023706.1 response regulator [Lysobacter niastensis]
MTHTPCVLVVDDDQPTREMLVEFLATQGYRALQAEDGTAMRRQLEHEAPDIVLLDVRLPGEDGLTLARYLRERYDAGIIMVTGSGDVVDRIVGLEIGADDYVAKPFDPRELFARIKSVLRRLQARPPSPSAAVPDQPLRVPFGRCTVDLGAHQVFDADGSEVMVTHMEFDLLRVLYDNPGKALSRDQILSLTKNREWEPFDRSIDIRIARLRRKVERDPDQPRAIRTVRGVGYMFVPEP